jgi:amino acid transporter
VKKLLPYYILFALVIVGAALIFASLNQSRCEEFGGRYGWANNGQLGCVNSVGDLINR